MIVNTFSNWLKLISCGTRPMQDFARSSSRSMSWPKTETVPPDFVTSDMTMPIVVVLPAPFGPSSAKKSPSCDVEVDAAQRLDAVRVGLGQPADGERLHEARLSHAARAGAGAAATGRARCRRPGSGARAAAANSRTASSGRDAQPSNCSQNRVRDPNRAVSVPATRRASRSTAATGIAADCRDRRGRGAEHEPRAGGARLREVPERP